MYPIKPKYQAPDNRKTRRTIFAERDYLLQTIWEFEHKFTLDLFSDVMERYSYEYIYFSYLKVWDILMEKLKKKKIKYFIIDEDYFEKIYRPIE